MKTIEVVAAIITDEAKVLATRRGYGEFINLWEFPGGKIEPGETKEIALIREIKEELDVTISPKQFLMTVEYDYPNFHLILHCFLCTITDGSLLLKEHNDAKWLTHDSIDSVEWLPADLQIVEALKMIF